MSESQYNILLRCAQCKEMKSLDCFHADNRPKAIKNRYGKKYRCIACYKQFHEQPHVKAKCYENSKKSINKFKKDKPDEYSERVRKQNLKSNYGLSVDEFDSLLRSQGGVCAICKTSEPGGKHDQFIVDHNHTTGGLRSILCNDCNGAIGYFQDNVVIIQNLIDYILKHR